MKNIRTVIIVLLLLLNGSGAIYGGLHLITHPDGSSLHMPLSVLEHSPFRSFLIPGIILFVANGMLSFVVLAALLLRSKNAYRLVVLEGAILGGWIIVQVAMLRAIAWLHIIFLSVGIMLLALGRQSKKIRKNRMMK